MAIVGAYVLPHPPIIFPEIGRGEQLKIQKTIDAYKEAARRIALMRPDTIIIVSPHSVMYQDYFHISSGAYAKGNFSAFGYSNIVLDANYDEELVSEIIREAQVNDIAAGTEGGTDRSLDHGTMIPLRFIKDAFTQPFEIVRVGLSGFSLEEHYRFGKCMKIAAKRSQKRIVMIASGDLSHRLLNRGPYDYAEEGPEYDAAVTKLLADGNLKEALNFKEEFCAKAGECGHRSIAILSGFLDEILLKSELLSYEGPFGVGYAVAAFQDYHTALARESLEYYLKYTKILPLSKNLPSQMLEQKAGAFVSWDKSNHLRGCIGTIQAVRENIAEEIIENAVSAGVCDPRFPSVQLSEMKQMICTVDILSEAEEIKSLNDLDVKKYGIIITEGRKRGLLLPNLEGVDTVKEQIDITLSKAGIDQEAYEQGKCYIERFEVVRHY